MKREPDFDELVGGEPTGAERSRLRDVHELLVQAGPPPELPPRLEAGPTLGMTTTRKPRQVRHRLALLAAAAIAVGVVFLGGYLVGNNGGGTSPSGTPVVRTVELRGTDAAPGAFAALRVEQQDQSGNWPLRLDVTGLPSLPPDRYYTVYLVRAGKPVEPCGWFAVSGTHAAAQVTMSVPYELEHGDSWIVTKHVAGARTPGPVVMRQTTT